MATRIQDKYEAHKAEVNERFEQLRANEEELNRIFAKIYNMEGEVPIEVEDKYVSVARIFDTAEEIPESYKGNRYVRTRRDEVVSLISYAVGCMFGRYSLDVDGLVLADQGATVADYLAKMPDPAHVAYMPDESNVIPITDDKYFEDDAVAKFVDFVRAAYGAETLEENLAFVADSLDAAAKTDARGTIRAYFLKDFFADHCSTYKKRPIYWQLDSGKKNGFKALVYLHRYRPDLMARVRTDYVHPQQNRLRGRIADLEEELTFCDARRKAAFNKELKRLNAQETELAQFEERVHRLADRMVKIDLDDGVKVNYALFQDVLTKVK